MDNQIHTSIIYSSVIAILLYVIPIQIPHPLLIQPLSFLFFYIYLLEFFFNLIFYTLILKIYLYFNEHLYNNI